MDLSQLETQTTSQLFETLLKVMATLRGPQGCPWDKSQTHKTLTSCLLEETYEVLATIDKDNSQHLKEELGDLLLQVVFHTQIAQENEEFRMNELLKTLIQKLVRRHPHVFGEVKASNPEEAIRRWEKIKASEKKPEDSILSGVPIQLPALLRAYRLGTKAARVGFDWKEMEGILHKIEEELKEMHEGLELNLPEVVEEEFGDLLFTVAQAARFFNLNPEEALRKSTVKFQRRFEKMEQWIKEQKKEFSDLTPEEWDQLWNQSKS